jgi:hypothetical protein
MVVRYGGYQWRFYPIKLLYDLLREWVASIVFQNS